MKPRRPPKVKFIEPIRADVCGNDQWVAGRKGMAPKNAGNQPATLNFIERIDVSKLPRMEGEMCDEL
jgi:hypothetical protein